MPTVELDETELAALPEMRRVWEVANKIAQNPKTRARMQDIVLEVAPDQAHPEAHARAASTERESQIEKKIDEFLDGQRKEREEREAADAKRQLETRWLEGRASARKAGYEGESLQNLEKFMEERSIADHEVAISHFERLNPPPPPAATGGSRFNFFEIPKDRPDVEKLFNQDYDGFLNEAIPAAVREARGG